MIKLLTFWAAIPPFRALVPIIVIATLALLPLGVNRMAGHGGGWVGRLQHAARPLEHQLERALQKASAP